MEVVAQARNGPPECWAAVRTWGAPQPMPAPRSRRLVLKSLAFADPETGAVVRRHFENAGVDASRVDVLPRSDSAACWPSTP